MKVNRPPLRRLLLMSFGAAAVLLVLWLLAGLAGDQPDVAPAGQQVLATVLKQAGCGDPDPHDTVSIRANGREHMAKLDGCGNRQQQTLMVLVPAGFTDGDAVEPADTASGPASGQAHRVAFLLLLVSTAIAGACSYLIHRRHDGIAGIRASAARPVSRTQTPVPMSSVETTGPAQGTNWFEDPSISATDR